jgi:aspartyl-tRNA(Asn)/glutamyl-tRNA(Gln) amidotransferase subunit C
MSASAPSSTVIDDATVKRVARLARIAVSEYDIPHLKAKMTAVLGMADKLAAVNVSDIEPMTSVAPMALIQREDVVTDGNRVSDILTNAPMSEDGYFMVPKVVE